MKSLIILFSFIMFAFQTLAQSPLEATAQAKQAMEEATKKANKAIEDSKRTVEDAEKQQKTIENQIKTQRKDLEEIHKRIAEENQYLEANKEKFEDKKGGLFGFFQGSLDDDFTNEYKRSQDRLKKLKESRKNESERLTTLNEKLGEAEDNLKYARQDLNSANRGLENTKEDYSKEYMKTKDKLNEAYFAVQKEMMDTKFLTMDHDLVEAKLNGVGTELDTLKSKYDNAMLGVYMRSRVLSLLNSPAFCEKAQTCAKGGIIDGQKHPTIDSDLDNVFPGMRKKSDSKSDLGNKGSRSNK